MISEEDLRALRSATRRLLADTTPASADAHEAAAAAPYDRATWRAFAERLGLQGVRVPDELGGTGLGVDAELVVHEEMGRAVHGGPFLPVVGQAVPALLELIDGETARILLADIAAGTAVVVPAYDPLGPLPHLQDGAGGPTVTGAVASVLAGADADGWLVPAVDGSERVLTWVPAGSGASAHPRETLDLTRGAAEVRLDAARAVVQASGPAAERACDTWESAGARALAAEGVGLAVEALRMTVEYVQVREQFGQAIAAFQGVKHQVAELYVLLESARSALSFAVRSADAEPTLRRAALAVARRRCGDAAFRIANETIHLHGGIGFTWEHRAHLYYRRAKANQVLLDPGGRQARALAADVVAIYAGAR